MSLPKSFAHTFQLIASTQRELRAGDATRLPPPRYRSKRRLTPPHAQQRNHCDRVSVVFDEISVAGLGAMNSADQPTPDECREVAAELRELAKPAYQRSKPISWTSPNASNVWRLWLKPAEGSGHDT